MTVVSSPFYGWQNTKGLVSYVTHPKPCGSSMAQLGIQTIPVFQNPWSQWSTSVLGTELHLNGITDSGRYISTQSILFLLEPSISPPWFIRVTMRTFSSERLLGMLKLTAFELIVYNLAFPKRWQSSFKPSVKVFKLAFTVWFTSSKCKTAQD